jgi:hypothetical protein
MIATVPLPQIGIFSLVRQIYIFINRLSVKQNCECKQTCCHTISSHMIEGHPWQIAKQLEFRCKLLTFSFLHFL